MSSWYPLMMPCFSRDLILWWIVMLSSWRSVAISRSEVLAFLHKDSKILRSVLSNLVDGLSPPIFLMVGDIFSSRKYFLDMFS